MDIFWKILFINPPEVQNQVIDLFFYGMVSPALNFSFLLFSREKFIAAP